MTAVGIEAINVFGGTAYVNLEELAVHRGLARDRFTNLLMKEKTVVLHNEDPVTFAVNAARPIVDRLTPEEKDRIELLVICSESGIDFAKSMSTYVHKHLHLNRNCRLFELKQACYSGTAGLQMALSFILSQASPGAKALVVASDICRVVLPPGVDLAGGGKSAAQADASALTSDWSFAEPSTGAGAVAVLVSEHPHVFQIDVGANGYYGYEVMDVCRPFPDGDAGNADLSLLSYLDCCENAFREYRSRVGGVDYAGSFHYLAFHTPFGGMVKGAHRSMMRKFTAAKPNEIEEDFVRRVTPGMIHCQRVGNIMGGTVLMSLASTIEHADMSAARRIGCFSYGSGCCSEFYSGVAREAGQRVVRGFGISSSLDARRRLTMDEYDSVLRTAEVVRFGTANVTLDESRLRVKPPPPQKPRLFLRAIDNFHREYEWAA